MYSNITNIKYYKISFTYLVCRNFKSKSFDVGHLTVNRWINFANHRIFTFQKKNLVMMPYDHESHCKVFRELHQGHVNQVGFENSLNDIVHRRCTIRLS